MARIMKTFTLDIEVCTLLETRAKETGEAMSRIVEDGIRAVLAMPLQAKAEADDTGHETGTMGQLVKVLAMPDLLERCKAQRDARLYPNPGVGWHFGSDIAALAGRSLNVAEKALQMLSLDGKVWRWGPGTVGSNGKPIGSTWSTLGPALERVRELCAYWKSRGADDSASRLVLVKRVRAMALGMSDSAQARRIVAEALGWTPDMEAALCIENFAEQEARESAERAAERKAFEAKTHAEWAAARARETSG